MEWTILQSPILLVLLLIALLLTVFEKKYNASKGVISVIATLTYVVALAFLCLNGAGYYELIVLLLVYLLFNVDTLKVKGD